MDSEGLLLLTNDGGLIHRLTDPRFNHPKTYQVQVEGIISQDALDRLCQGVPIQGSFTKISQVKAILEPALPERAKPITPHGPTCWIEMTLYEGKKRQIRHMTAAVGFPTLRIVRIAVGPVRLGDLQPGQSQPLSRSEIEALLDLANPSSQK